MPVYSSKAVYGDAYQIDFAGTTSSGPGDGFDLAGSATWRQHNTAFGGLSLGTTATTISGQYLLVMGGTSSICKINGGAEIPAGTTVEISMWLIRDSASHNDGSGNGMTLGQSGNKLEDNEFVNLEQADNSSFSGSTYVPVRWRKSTTLDGTADSYTELANDGRIKADEIPLDDGFGSGGTMNHYRITFTVPSGGKFYRLGKTNDAAALADFSYHYGLQVKMSPVTITSAVASGEAQRNVYVNESKPSHASVILASSTTANAHSHTPFNEGTGGSPTVLSISGGMKYDSTDGRFIVPDEGMYEIHVVGQISNTSTGGGLSSFRIMKNFNFTSRENLLWTQPSIGSSTNFEPSYVLHGIVRLAAGNWVQLFVDTADAGTVSLQQGSTFTIQRVG